MNVIMYTVKTRNQWRTFPSDLKSLADGGHHGQKIIDIAQLKLALELSVVLWPKNHQNKFYMVPLRWIVEQMFF